MVKKFGGTIRNWQIHNLSITKKQIREVYNNKRLKPMVFTGTVVDDPTGMWYKGYHMRSSLIEKIDRKKGIIETRNTIYKVINEGNDIFQDMGDKITSIYY